MKGGLLPLSLGGFGGPPPRKFSVLLCAFSMGIYAFGTRFQSFWSQSFARKDISCCVRNRMLHKNCFQRVTLFFYSMFL